MEQDKKTDDVRGKIARFLPDAIAQALNSYHDFITEPEEESRADGTEEPDNISRAKRFSAQHSALKAAVAHIEHLVKLAQWVEKNGKPGASDRNLKTMTAGMVEQAISEVQGYKDRTDAQNEDEGEGEA